MLFYQDFNEQFEGYTQREQLTMTATMLFYQDFNEQFEGYTQLLRLSAVQVHSCFIRISMNNLKDIHNEIERYKICEFVVLSGFQ